MASSTWSWQKSRPINHLDDEVSERSLLSEKLVISNQDIKILGEFNIIFVKENVTLFPKMLNHKQLENQVKTSLNQ